MRVVAVFTALLAVAFAAPSLEKRQQGENCVEVFFPESCADRGLVECDDSLLLNGPCPEGQWNEKAYQDELDVTGVSVHRWMFSNILYLE
ncbi:hypothetical protein BJX68DRAFT_264533 [Aspergillus pseudodeflectus]|uniref:Uncharacterized protein n=1 Tax=Aspergillus pseudodeflectus TaxID=176178 RepID=A0ABR4KQS5_9EURO